MYKLECVRRGWLGVAILVGLVAGFYLFQQDTGVVQASLNGRVGFSGNPATNSGANCTACHATGATLPTVTLQGPTTVTAGTTNLYTLLINGGPAQTGGLNISTSNNRGTLLPTGADTQALLGELTHAAPKAFSNGQLSFTFAWTAPTFNDTVTLYGAGNSTDGQQSLSGDGIGTTTLTVQVTSGTGGPPASSPTPPPATLGLRRVVAGLEQPTNITHAGDARLFVAEKVGRLRIIQNGTLLTTPFLNLVGKVATGEGSAETGLLGLAFHPDYANNGYFYLNYTVDSPLRTRIARFSVSATDPNLADPNSELILMEYSQPFNNHNGGQLQFGSDGYLYIASGDGGSGGDPQNYGQNNNVLLGKLLRIDVNASSGNGPDCDITGNTNYRIPPDNPFANGEGGACDEIWATGLRNPWRFSFDRLTGDLWIGDVGQNRFEEVDFTPAGSNGGENYGWRCYEGNTAYNTTGCQTSGSYTAPIHVYNRNAGDCSITGGYVYRGTAYPNLNGHYFFSDFCNKSMRSISGAPADVAVTAWSTSGGGSSPITFGQDVNGELYVGYFSGEIYQLTGIGLPGTATPTATPTPLPTDTPTATATPTPTATPTFIPTATPTATPTPTSTSTPTGAIVRVGRATVPPDQAVTTTLAVEVINIPAETPLGALTLVVTYDQRLVTVTGCAAPTPNRFDSLLCNIAEAGIVRLSALATAGIAGDALIAQLIVQSPGNVSTVAPFAVAVTTFVDVNATPLAVNREDGAFIFDCRTGDVNCDDIIDPTDALFIMQHTRGQRPLTATIPPPRGFLYQPACDLNGDTACSAEDARVILQCEIGLANAFCNSRGE